MTQFESVESWISLCQEKHTKLCSIKDSSSVPGLKLIDCITSDIILAEDTPYLALSYVWGSGSEVSENPNRLLETVPNTIEDAIIVGKKLGYRYIWVDRYCINQENEEEKVDQCGKMDLIYQNADLTITATGEPRLTGFPALGYAKGSLAIGRLAQRLINIF